MSEWELVHEEKLEHRYSTWTAETGGQPQLIKTTATLKRRGERWRCTVGFSDTNNQIRHAGPYEGRGDTAALVSVTIPIARLP